MGILQFTLSEQFLIYDGILETLSVRHSISTQRNSPIHVMDNYGSGSATVIVSKNNVLNASAFK